MARFSEAEWLGEHSPKSLMARWDVLCVHTIVGYAPAHAAHFSVHHDGRIQQSRDTQYKSAANLYGNHRVIAIENEDHGPGFPDWSGSNVPPLTSAQVTANAKILAWAHKVHGIPLQLNPNSRSNSRGLGYHRQGCDGNFGSLKYPGRVSDGELWSRAFGKVCPGDRRIDQLPEILRQAKAIVSGDPINLEESMFCRKSDTGPAVEVLQLQLRALGFYDGKIDGDYGPNTSAGVLAMRKSQGSTAKSGDSYGAWAYWQMQQALAVHFSSGLRAGHANQHVRIKALEDDGRIEKLEDARQNQHVRIKALEDIHPHTGDGLTSVGLPDEFTAEIKVVR